MLLFLSIKPKTSGERETKQKQKIIPKVTSLFNITILKNKNKSNNSNNNNNNNNKSYCIFSS